MSPHQFQHNHSDVCSACGETYDAEIHGLGVAALGGRLIDDESEDHGFCPQDEVDSGFDEPEEI